MILTEAEAKVKRCPQKLVNPQHHRAFPGIVCEASNCMAWKWMDNEAPEELERRKAWNPNPATPRGYCGL